MADRMMDAAGLVVRERSDLTFYSVAAERGRAGATAAALGGHLGLAAPISFHRAAAGQASLSWLGPGRWLVESGRAAGDREAELRGLLDGIAGVTDESDGWIVLDLSGPRVIDALAKLVPIDLDPRRFREGDLALTVCGHINVRLWHLGAAGGYRLSAFLSYGQSLFRAVGEAGGEYGLETVRSEAQRGLEAKSG